MKRIIALLLCISMVFCMAACKNEEEQKKTDYKGTDVAIKTENFSFNMAEVTYIFNRYYQEFAEENAQYLSFYGIDKTKSLKEQQYTQDTTWFDYFLDLSVSYIEELILFCEGAKKTGVTISEDDKKNIDDIINKYVEEAEGNDYKIDEYVALAYGEDVTIDDIKSFMEKEQLAINYYNSLIDNYVFSEADEDKYLSEHPDEFYYVDYMSYTFDEAKDRDAMMNARELAATVGEEGYYSYIDTYENEVLSLEEDKKKGAILNDYQLKDGELGEWAFSAEIGDKYVVENGAKGVYVVYMLVKRPAIQDYTIRDIRYICLSKKTYSTNEDAKNKANEIIENWVENGQSAEEFGNLAKKYSNDDSTKENGGICEGVDRANSILDAEGEKWLFEEAQVGDYRIFKGEEMYYIVYYEKEGRIQWRANAADSLSLAEYVKDTDKLKAEYKVEQIKEVLNAIDE